MILVDFSGIIFQELYASINLIKPHKDANGKYITEEYMPLMYYKIIESLINIQEKFNTYGDLVLCLDGDSKHNWRKRLYPMYKASRPISRANSDIDFPVVFECIYKLYEILDSASPWKLVKVAAAEGDDVIMVLSKYLNACPVLILSSDKDLIQMQQYKNIHQYSFITKQYVTSETKHDDTMDEWLLEHVILGDKIDDVPRVIDGMQFTDKFKEFMASNHLNLTEREVRNSDWYKLGYSEYVLDKNGNPKYLDIFKRERFGITTCKKMIKQWGTLDAWLDSDPFLRDNYNLNRKLVLEEGIPDDIRIDIICAFLQAPAQCQLNKFKAFLQEYNISQLELFLPVNFQTKSAEGIFS